MKLLNQVQEIIKNNPWEKYKIPEGYKSLYTYLNEDVTRRKFPEYCSVKNDSVLFKKYDSFIPQGWYGFAIGDPIHPEWMEIIDQVLELCTIQDPDFEIHQIKTKYGSIRFYVQSSIIEDINKIEDLMEELYDEVLVY